MDSKHIRVLVLEDEAAHAEAVRRALYRALELSGTHFEIQVAGSLSEYRESVAANPPDIALLDMVLPDGRSLELLTSPPEASPFPMLIMTSHGDEQAAVAAMKAGALDYVVKSPEAFADMPHTLARVLSHWQLLQERQQAEEALRQSEENFRALAKNASDGIIITSADGGIVYANRQAAGITGHTLEELLQTDMKKLAFPGRLQELLRRHKDRRKAKPIPSRYETIIVHKDRRIVPTEIAAATTTWHGKPATMFFLCDITERKQAEEKLRRKEEHFRALIENASDAIAIIGGDGIVRYQSPSYLKVLGYVSEEEVGRSLFDNIQPDDVTWVSEDFARMLQDPDYTPHFEMRIRVKDGSWRTIEGESRNLLHYPAVEGIVVNFRDITKRRQAEEALRESETKYRTLFDATLDGTVVIDAETSTILAANEAAAKMYGFDSAKDAIGVSLLHFVAPEEKERVVRVITEDLFQKDLREVNEFRTLTKDGREIWISALGVRTEYEGRLAGLISFRDVTEHKRAEEELQRKEEHFRSLIENASDAIVILDGDGTVRYQSPSYLRVLGYVQEEEVGGNLFDHIHPDDITWVSEDFARLLQDPGYTSHFEVRVRVKDGSWRFIEGVSRNLLHYPAVEGIVVNFRDVTQRRQAEEALQKAKEFTDSLITSMRDGISVLDSHGVHTDVNPAFCQMTGFSREELIGTGPPHPYWPPESLEAIERAFQKTLRGEFESLELTFMRKDGGRFPVIVSPSLVKDTQENVVSYFATVKDITDRKRAEEALRESEQRYRELFENAGEAILVVQDGKLVFANPMIIRMTGYPSAEIMAKPFIEFVHPDDRDMVLERHLKRLKGEEIPPVYAFRIIDGAGNTLWVELNAILIKWKGKAATLIFVRDITERKQLEEERQRVEKLESIGTLAGGIAHDFNNILTGILGNITLAQRYVEPESQAADRLLEAEKASLRAKDLTQQLLTFSTGGAPVKKTASIAELLQESATFALRGSKVRCEFSLPDDLWPVEVDEGQMSQVITNLILNADQAMPGGGTINIRAENTVIKGKGDLPLPKGNYIKITVKDQGIGIPKKHLAKIFDPYFTTKQKGSGLGLATTYSIIKNHEGYITVESEVGVGTTFHIQLPASKKPAPVKAKAKKEAPVGGKGRILVMDDEEMIRKMLSKMLPLDGYDVELAKDGAEAVELYRKARESGQPFDAVIMDLTIPGGMGGKEAIKKLLEIDPDVKAIVSSGYATDPIMADFKKYGFSAVVTKPYSFEELEKTLRNMLT
jgi:PAS domain S-box-containing protein